MPPRFVPDFFFGSSPLMRHQFVTLGALALILVESFFRIIGVNRGFVIERLRWILQLYETSPLIELKVKAFAKGGKVSIRASERTTQRTDGPRMKNFPKIGSNFQWRVFARKRKKAFLDSAKLSQPFCPLNYLFKLFIINSPIKVRR